MSNHPANNTPLTWDILELDVSRLQQRIPDLPLSAVLTNKLLVQLSRCIATMLESRTQPFGLTYVEFQVLTVLFAQPDGCANPTTLCEKSLQSPTRMTRVGDTLVDRGLVTRSRVGDRRKILLRITEGGEELVRRLVPLVYGPLQQSLRDFSHQDQLQLISILKNLGAPVLREAQVSTVTPIAT